MSRRQLFLAPTFFSCLDVMVSRQQLPAYIYAWSSAEDVARPPPFPPKYIYLDLMRSTLYIFVGHPVNQI